MIAYRIESKRHKGEGPVAGKKFTKDVAKAGPLGHVLIKNITNMFEGKKYGTELDTDKRVEAMGKANFKTKSYFTKKHFEGVLSKNQKQFEGLMISAQNLGLPLVVKKVNVKKSQIIDSDKQQILVKTK